MKDLFIVSLIVTACFIGFILIMGVSGQGYNLPKLNDCEKYNIIPVEYIDRVPNGCMSYYFEYHNNDR